ncbi:MAG: DUF4097 family beta strand repeat protein [Acidobacteria bacterium]|nr:DUF4097 family beta strand repeat protein [Acidobacteriota bacterium]
MATTNPLPVRRGSLVGPLIILLLGVIFLIGNLRPDLSLWRLFARYWPFLLIFWGVGRLVEYAVARAGGRAMSRGLGGGEIFLIILICIAGTSFSAVERTDWRIGRLGHRGLEVFGENFDFTTQYDRRVPPNATVLIQNLQGNVRVVGADSTDKMAITSRKSVKAFDRSAAEQADKETPLEITEQGGQILVRTNQDRMSGNRRVSADLEISVPKSAALRLEGRYGDWDVKDVAGPVEVTSANAGVRLSNITKNVRVDLRRSDIVRATQVKGSVEITGRGRDIELETIAGTVNINGDFSGNIKLQDLAKGARYTSTVTELSIEKLPGRVEMDLGSLHATNIVGPFRLNARSKDVRIEGFSKEMEITSRRGDIDLRDAKLPLANIHAESQNGSIELELPANAVFSLDAKSANGRVDNQFSEAIKVEDWSKSPKRRGAVATKTGPGAQIRLSTDRGDITLKKAGHLQSL